MIPKIYFPRSKSYWGKQFSTKFPTHSSVRLPFFIFLQLFHNSISQAIIASCLLCCASSSSVIIHRGAAQNKSSSMSSSSPSSSSSAQKLVISTPLLMVQVLGHFMLFIIILSSRFTLPTGKSELASGNGLRNWCN